MAGCPIRVGDLVRGGILRSCKRLPKRRFESIDGTDVTSDALEKARLTQVKQQRASIVRAPRALE